MNAPINITNMSDLEVKEMMQEHLEKLLNQIIKDNEPSLSEISKDCRPEPEPTGDFTPSRPPTFDKSNGGFRGAESP